MIALDRIAFGVCSVTALIVAVVCQDPTELQRVRRLEFVAEDGSSVFRMSVDSGALLLESIGAESTVTIAQVSPKNCRISLSGGDVILGDISLPAENLSKNAFGITVRAGGTESPRDASAVLVEDPAGGYQSFLLAKESLATCGSQTSGGSTAAGFGAQAEEATVYVIRNGKDALATSRLHAGGARDSASLVETVRTRTRTQRAVLATTDQVHSLAFRELEGEDLKSVVEMRSDQTLAGFAVQSGEDSLEATIHDNAGGFRVWREGSKLEAIIEKGGLLVLAESGSASIALSRLVEGLSIVAKVATGQLRALIEEADLRLEWRTGDDVESPPRWQARVPGSGDPESVFR